MAVVVRRIAANFPGAARFGVDIAIASDLPRNAGFSSSSVLVVAVAITLIRRGSLDERPEWQRAMKSVPPVTSWVRIGWGPIRERRW